MCPRSYQIDTTTKKMSDKLYNKILKEIADEKNSFSWLWLYLQNEPLLDENIFKKLEVAKKVTNNDLSTALATNGTLFNKGKIKELENSKVDEIEFSIDAFTRETYEKIRKDLNFCKVLENIDNVLKSKYSGRVSVGFVIQDINIKEIFEFKKYWKNRGVPINFIRINSRSGDLKNFNELSMQNYYTNFFRNMLYNFGRELVNRCHHVFSIFNILANGDVILCCNDYSKKIILGNVNESSIKEIWNSKKYQNVRKIIFSGKFDKIPVCAECTINKPR
jgi:radical SAM protein with 4Fe4S-binding SPASM domain